jgi:NTP pyrophosphatase (non-canonical NTP hydrolase)
VSIIFNDKQTTISFFKDEIAEFVNKREWGKYHSPKNLIQALQIEAAELSELFLFKDDPIEQILSNHELLEDISDEIADIFIYLISIVNVCRIDLTKAFSKKMKKNSEKYSIKEFNNGIYYKK